MAIAAQEQPTRFDMPTWLRSALVFGLIYTFLVGVSALEKGIKIMGEDTQEKLFSSVDNPIAGLCVGILGTVLVQSSSASTSIIVGLVATGGISVEAAVPMIMGANIGTTVTNTLVSLGHVRQSSEFKRAFAAATVHDFFNVMAVALLLPLELLTGVVSKTATWMSDRLVGTAGSEWKSPVKTWVKKPVEWIVDIWEAVGLNGNVLGTTVVLTGLVIVLLSLTFITKNMRELVADRVERSVNNVLGKGSGSIAMLLGLAITVAVQSSSITTSILIPLAAAGVLSLRNAYPVTLGANVGTTITALLAALAASVTGGAHGRVGAYDVQCHGHRLALRSAVHSLRPRPARGGALAEVAFRRPAWAVVYVMTAFIVLPLIGVGIFG